MLKLTDITWPYQHLPMRFSLTVERGEQVAILGPSGAGKSTLLNLIAGFLTPASGSLTIDGVDHTTTPPSRRPVSMLFQENNLFSHLTVAQNIGLGLNPGLKLNAAQQEKMHAIARQMGIDPAKFDRRFSDASQRFADYRRSRSHHDAAVTPSGVDAVSGEQPVQPPDGRAEHRAGAKSGIETECGTAGENARNCPSDGD